VASVFTLMMNPGRRRADPEPVGVDLTGAFLVGTAVWIIALVVTLIRWHTGDGTSTSVWTCVAGIVGGFGGLAWARHVRPLS